MNLHLRRACEEIDAAMFSGDAFHDDKALSELEGYLGRWQREAEATRRLIEAQQLEEDQA